MSGEVEASPVIASRFDEFSPALSPDGRWLAYVSDETGRLEVYLRSFLEERGRRVVSAGGGTEPVWSADGRELFYRSGDRMMAVPVRFEPDLELGAPELVFERPLKHGIYDSLSYDVSADGERFLMIERRLDLTPTEVRVVLDWGSELEEKLTASR
jgi:hypothetical protein